MADLDIHKTATNSERNGRTVNCEGDLKSASHQYTLRLRISSDTRSAVRTPVILRGSLESLLRLAKRMLLRGKALSTNQESCPSPLRCIFTYITCGRGAETVRRETGQGAMGKENISIAIVPFGTSASATLMHLAPADPDERGAKRSTPRVIDSGTTLTYFVSSPAPTVKT